MADDDRRAEIEVMAAAIRHVVDTYCPDWGRRIDWERPDYAEQSRVDARFVLDRVRDARGDDEPRTDREKFGTYPSLSAQCADGRHRECFTSQVCRCDCHRSPQDEDHEAGIPYCDVCRCFRPAGQCGFESHGQKRPENCPRSPQGEGHEEV